VFDRFTEPARQAVSDAQRQSRALGHYFIGVEHLLLGLLTGPDSEAAAVLRPRGVSEEAFRARLLEIIPGGGHEPPHGTRPPFSPRAKKVLELALREALALGTNAVGTEHLLLRIARERESVAIRILRERWNLHPEAIRGAVIESLPEPQRRLIPANRGVPLPMGEPSIGGVQVAPSLPLRRLLVAAAGLAVDDGRTEIDVDVWLALTRTPVAIRLASVLGIDEDKVREAIERRDAASDPPEAPTGA
jgi:hypothetical protein